MITTRTHFTFRVDTWTPDGESIVEHIAGVEDYQVALATYRGDRGTPLRPLWPVWLPPEPGRAWMLGWRGPHEAQRGLIPKLADPDSCCFRARTGSGSTQRHEACFGVKVADFFEQLWCCCNTLTILKESPTAERIAWFAT
jgi:hypothetical protein